MSYAFIKDILPRLCNIATGKIFLGGNLDNSHTTGNMKWLWNSLNHITHYYTELVSFCTYENIKSIESTNTGTKRISEAILFQKNSSFYIISKAYVVFD